MVRCLHHFIILLSRQRVPFLSNYIRTGFDNFSFPSSHSPPPVFLSNTCMALPRHQELYKDDGNVVFAVGDNLYRLHRSLLSSHSEYFTALFGFTSHSPPSADKPTIGSTDDEPIVVREDPKIFELVVRWMYQQLYHRYDNDKNPIVISTEQHVLLLESSDFYQMPRLKDHATAQLEHKLDDIRPAKRVELARRFGIQEWLHPAFFQIVTGPVEHLRAEDLDLLGPTTVHLLMQHQAAMSRLRKTLAYAPITGHHIVCTRRGHNGQCDEAWIAFWREKVAERLLKPESVTEENGMKIYHQYRMTNIIAFLCRWLIEEANEIPGMTDECRKVVWEKIYSNGAGAFHVDTKQCAHVIHACMAAGA